MKIPHLIVGVILLGLTVGLVAQQPSRAVPAFDHFMYWSHAKLQALSGELQSKEPTVAYGVKRMQAAEVLGNRQDFTCFVERREAEPHWPELHADWDDLVIVQEGSANLLHGGKIENGRDMGKGEIRDGKILGGSSQKLGPGDTFYIPAGTPHQYFVDSGNHFYFLVVKVKKP